ncbi:TPA: hypothetical protein ENS27_10310 [bacterium]|nr:hypothetical protein [bacterium]
MFILTIIMNRNIIQKRQKFSIKEPKTIRKIVHSKWCIESNLNGLTINQIIEEMIFSFICQKWRMSYVTFDG